MKRYFWMLTILPLLSNAQKGIDFEQGFNWKQIVEKANKEKKMIFVDCYTTWCTPCKKMEKDVYTQEKVGDYLNQYFVCIKLQMDSNKNDNQLIINSYPVAKAIASKYKVFSYPTYLFFDSEGNILSKGDGLLTSDEFLKLCEDVRTPQKNYYNVLNKYKNGTADLPELSFLAKTALHLIGDTNTAKNVSNQYFLQLKKKDWFTRFNIELLQEFTKKSKDVGFRFFYENKDTINKIMGQDNYAQGVVKTIIFKEIVLPMIRKQEKEGKIPDWNGIELAIRSKYNKYYSEIIVAGTKVDWYRINKRWPEYTKAMVAYVDNYLMNQNLSGHWPAFTLNNFAWNVFKYSNNREELNRALCWSNKAVSIDPIPNWMDTYANILYKLGKDDLGIRWEEIATKLAPDDQDIKSMHDKMKKGECTWILPEGKLDGL